MNKLKNIIMVTLIVIFTISIVPKAFQNDTFFTIAIGEKILNNEDVNSLIWHENVKFVHSGYFDIVITNIYNIFNFCGIYIFVIIIAIIQMLLYYFILNKMTKKRELSFLATIITTIYIYNEFTARAQILSFTIFLLEFYCIDNVVNNFKKRYVIMLIILPIILANLHSSVFPVYFAIYLPYIAQFILSKFNLKSEDNKIIITKKNAKILLVLFFVSFLLGLCSPTTFSVYTDMFKAMKGISTNFISELQPLNIFEEIYFSILVIILISIIGFTKTKVRITDLLYVLGFGLMSLSTYRCVFFFYLISSLCIFRIVNEFLDLYNVKLDIKNKYIKYTGCILFCLFIIICSIKQFTKNLSQEYADIIIYPVEIADYIVENLDVNNIKIYNDFNVGSYLEFKGIRVFIDSRSGMFTPEFNPNCTVLSDWYGVSQGKISYKNVFEKYDISYVLVNKDEIINQYIMYDDEWEILYDTGQFSLYEKVNK